MDPADRLEIKSGSSDQIGVSLVRVNLKGMERSCIWKAALLHAPDDIRLVIEMRQPWMNFKEASRVLANFLGKDRKRMQFLAVPGGRTYFPTETELEKLTEPKPKSQEPPPKESPDMETWRMRSTF
jgi:hypothetical protein